MSNSAAAFSTHSQPAAQPNQSAAIIADQLCKRVRDADGWLSILSDVQLNIAQGETVAIVGASGSGKSTLLGLLAGLDTPSSGSVTLMGQSLFDLNEDGRARWRSKQVGFVFQSFQLLTNLTALENVLLPLELTGAANASARATEMLASVGLSDRLKHYPRTLSGGEQQRVALARAFALNPPVLFADEPTGSLDSATGERIIELLFNMNQASHSTLILVTHDKNLAQRCGRIITIAAGQVLSDERAGVQ
jgi:putative ABC transport system ATP-binding protein